MTIGRITRVPLRDVWPHEAFDFTTWLRDNIEVLNETLSVDLATAESEQAAGSFSVDILAEESSGQTVVIENQLGRSDHDHLGKVITYLTSFDARAAVWMVGEARPEHVQAVAWLNESSAADFFLVKVEAIQIAGSPPAPLLTLLVGPSEEAKEIGRQKGEIAERELLRQDFWTVLLEMAHGVTPMFANVTPSRRANISTQNIPFDGVFLSYWVGARDSGGYLYIDAGPGGELQNKDVFEVLNEAKSDIEAAFGGPLEWTPPDGRRSARVMFRLEAGGYRDREDWPEIQEATVDGMKRFWNALHPHLDQWVGRKSTGFSNA